jgi:hypothetical protein
MSLLGNAPKAARFLRCDTAQSEFLEIAFDQNLKFLIELFSKSSWGLGQRPKVLMFCNSPVN